MRWFRWILGAYLLVAALTRLAEASGMHRRGCAASCWCKRPVLSTVRWVFPFRHRSIDPSAKEALAQTP